MEKIVIFGTGQTAEIIYQYFKRDDAFNVVAFTGEQQFLDKKTMFDLPVVSFENIQEQYPPSQYKMFIAIGYANLNSVRAEKYYAAKDKGYELVSYIDKKSGLSPDIPVGDNCCIMENQTIQPYAEIGNNVFVWGGALIAHHARIGDHCWITSEVSIAGNTTIGPYCFIGINATIGHMISIGEKCLIGAGALITKSADDKGVYITPETERFAIDSERFLKLSNMR